MSKNRKKRKQKDQVSTSEVIENTQNDMISEPDFAEEKEEPSQSVDWAEWLIRKTMFGTKMVCSACRKEYLVQDREVIKTFTTYTMCPNCNTELKIRES